MGRPSSYTTETADQICDLLSGGYSLRKVCEMDGKPDISTVRKWLCDGNYPEFSLQYARAREEQADYYADQIVDIADNAKDSNLARVQIDARKWYSSKLRPKKYGDLRTIDQNITGKLTVEKLTDDELDAQLVEYTKK